MPLDFGNISMQRTFSLALSRSGIHILFVLEVWLFWENWYIHSVSIKYNFLYNQAVEVICSLPSGRDA